MRTVLQEKAIHNGHNNLTSHSGPKTKISGNSSRRRSRSTPVRSQIPERDDHLAIENGLQIRGQKTRSDQTSIVIAATVLSSREFITKPKSQVSLKGLKQRRLRKDPEYSSTRGANDTTDSKGLLRSAPLSLMSAPAPRQAPPEALVQGEGAACTRDPGEEDTDGGSDLSDMERFPAPPPVTGPPQLHLRADVLDRASPPPSKGHRRHRGDFPDFLPPPFNSWSLQQLAVYLNTDGRGMPRPRPSSQLERYLERLLQMEWQQIQTVQEESSKPAAPACAGLHRPQAGPHGSLSAPKTILHCPRAFPLALLSSLGDAAPCCDYTLRSHAHTHCSHLGPLPEGRGRAAAPARRSSSETRTRQIEHIPAPRRHRLSDPLDCSDHLKRMQAIGNIRNPTASPCCAQHVSSTTNLEAGPSRGRGSAEGEGRSRSCGDMRKSAHTAHKPSQYLSESSESASATGAEGVESSTDSAIRKPVRKQKHVEFALT